MPQPPVAERFPEILKEHVLIQKATTFGIEIESGSRNVYEEPEYIKNLLKYT